jgi:glutathione S-transferase
MAADLIFYTYPESRGRIVHWMLEEVGAPYETRILDLAKGEHKAPSYLAVNPMGKVPAILHRSVVVTETPAILMYLADAFPQAGLAPETSDPQRAPYVRWFFFGANCVEPAIVDKLLARPAVERKSTLGYGSYEDTVSTLEGALNPGPFVLGERFSAVDVYLCSQIGWGLFAGSLEPRPTWQRYLERCGARPAYRRVNQGA